MESETIAAMSGVIPPDGEVRQRLARRFTPEALRTQLRYSALFVVLCSVTLVKHLLIPPPDRRRYVTAVLWVLSSSWWAFRAWRQQPRSPESFSRAELRRAVARGRSCPRCGALVLLGPEFRCAKCGSLRVQLTLGGDGRAPATESSRASAAAEAPVTTQVPGPRLVIVGITLWAVLVMVLMAGH